MVSSVVQIFLRPRHENRANSQYRPMLHAYPCVCVCTLLVKMDPRDFYSLISFPMYLTAMKCSPSSSGRNHFLFKIVWRKTAFRKPQWSHFDTFVSLFILIMNEQLFLTFMWWQHDYPNYNHWDILKSSSHRHSFFMKPLQYTSSRVLPLCSGTNPPNDKFLSANSHCCVWELMRSPGLRRKISVAKPSNSGFGTCSRPLNSSLIHRPVCWFQCKL